jgi:hypothetical protein
VRAVLPNGGLKNAQSGGKPPHSKGRHEKSNVPAEAGTLEGRQIVRLESHWLGNRRRVQPVVLMSRNNGVRGGNKAGVRKFVSKLYPRVGGL